jgi:hypothetical protein
MVHNAMSSVDAGFVVFANHINDPIVESLDAGKYKVKSSLCEFVGVVAPLLTKRFLSFSTKISPAHTY